MDKRTETGNKTRTKNKELQKMNTINCKNEYNNKLQEPP